MEISLMKMWPLMFLLLELLLNLLWLVGLYQPQDVFVLHDTLNELCFSNLICEDNETWIMRAHHDSCSLQQWHIV